VAKLAELGTILTRLPKSLPHFRLIRDSSQIWRSDWSWSHRQRQRPAWYRFILRPVQDRHQTDGHASEAILALKPVTFRYKEELDPDKIPQFGLVAEEVEKVDPDLVVRGEDGKVMTVRYEAVNAMLLNEFLKEHRKVEEQGATIVRMQKQMEALTATIQKVSDQLALSKPAAQLVANP
jgi:hypothetical protein